MTEVPVDRGSELALLLERAGDQSMRSDACALALDCYAAALLLRQEAANPPEIEQEGRPWAPASLH